MHLRPGAQRQIWRPGIPRPLWILRQLVTRPARPRSRPGLGSHPARRLSESSTGNPHGVGCAAGAFRHFSDVRHVPGHSQGQLPIVTRWTSPAPRPPWWTGLRGTPPCAYHPRPHDNRDDNRPSSQEAQRRGAGHRDKLRAGWIRRPSPRAQACLECSGTELRFGIQIRRQTAPGPRGDPCSPGRWWWSSTGMPMGQRPRRVR